MIGIANIFGENSEINFEIINGKTSGVLTLKNFNNGIGTTFGVGIRRAILEFSEGYSVVALSVNGGAVKHIFEIIPDCRESVLDMLQMITKSKYSIEGSNDIYELRGSLDGEYLDLKQLETQNVLISPSDGLGRIATFTGNRSFEIRVLLMKNCGFVSKETNEELLLAKGYNLDEWIVTDSNHGPVKKVAYNSKVVLGKETVTLGIELLDGNVEEVVNKCIDKLSDGFTQIAQSI